ncbi:hypothetical protein LXA43DRAFT_1091979 [Ganoderma leucocontextum]|nr:hypothetical protein LXA43DRAFT_1091979 [Ganoderma leucocontextum]
MELNGSYFLTRATDEHKDSIAVVSSVFPRSWCIHFTPLVLDDDFLNAMNPSSSQFSSLSDFISITKTRYTLDIRRTGPHNNPEIDKALFDLAQELYIGHGVNVEPLTNSTACSFARTSVHKGTLYIDALTPLGMDALEKMKAKRHVSLRPTPRDEFRFDIGLPPLNGTRSTACFPYWVVLDNWGVRNNAPITAIYFTGSNDGWSHVPSLSLVTTRVKLGACQWVTVN